MDKYIENGAKRQRICDMASSSSETETMSLADKVFEVFMPWFLDERIHLVINEWYQWLEVVMWHWEMDRDYYKKYPEDFLKIAAEKEAEGTPRYFDPKSHDFFTSYGREKFMGCQGMILCWNKLLVDKKELPTPLIRRKRALGEDGKPVLPSHDAHNSLCRILKEYGVHIDSVRAIRQPKSESA